MFGSCVAVLLVFWLAGLLPCWFAGLLVVVLASVVPICSMIWFWFKVQVSKLAPRTPRSSDADLSRSTQLG